VRADRKVLSKVASKVVVLGIHLGMKLAKLLVEWRVVVTADKTAFEMGSFLVVSTDSKSEKAQAVK
jgi:hypothetical protein